MSTITKQDILEAIRQTAKDNGGKPLGIARFEKETGIKEYECSKYWARFGDAQKEAGLIPNKLQGAHDEGFLITKIIGIMRKLGKFPTNREISVERGCDSELPAQKTFQRLGTKKHIATKVIEYCQGKAGYADVVEQCKAILEEVHEDKSNDNPTFSLGEVYLFKSGRYYKIGKTNNTVRRGKEIRIQLPERTELIHVIKTDDPSGIEAYWHKRFETKRMQGEWFNLSSADIKAFKRWRRIA